MKKNIAFLACLWSLVACETAPKGNPALVKQAEKIAELGCKCQDVKCLQDIRVEGKSVIIVLQKSKLEELTKEEKEKFYAASRKYMDCEHNLTEKNKK